MKVKFLPQDIELEIEPYQNVMDLATKNGLKIKSVCNGMPSCAECRVRLVEGEANVLPPSASELNLIGTGHFIDQRRLSCQLVCFGDITVDLSEQVEKAKQSEHRRPQGNLRKEQASVSHAITGNLIEQDKDMVEESKSNRNPGSGKSGSEKNKRRFRRRSKKN